MEHVVRDVTESAEQIRGGVPVTAGRFDFRFADQRWEWSDEVAAMHGYAKGEAHPTTELLLSHKHPDDREYVATLISDAVTNSQAFCSRHRIIDVSGAAHEVIVVADTLIENDAIVGTTGFYIDLTEIIDQERKEALDEALPDLHEARAAIEQAKGVLRYVYRISPDQAFGVLRWRSQETNTKLRDLAAQIMADLNTLPGPAAHTQTQFDHLLLTAHLRITPGPEQ
ncbi:ANTAR domain-containing protein [Nocardia sp. NEAU-351]|uniref:ANTAR domain-containing protein n=1 Tax=Nocardia bovistercoris TaxID=2785916 RepID=A0A931IIU2_9NOCA|nr:ANTAR domain-containing protein [Nocardia bovistercoris]